jgi:hypothetical protein
LVPAEAPRKKTENTSACWAAVLADGRHSRRETAPHDLYLAVRLGTDIVMSPVMTPDIYAYQYSRSFVDSSYTYQFQSPTMARESAAVLSLTCRTARPWVRLSTLTISPGIRSFSSHMLLGSNFWGNQPFQSRSRAIKPKSTARSRHPGFLSPVYRVSDNLISLYSN